MAKVKAVLTISVTYEDESGSMSSDQMIADARSLLNGLASTASNRGLLSGDSEMIVDDWSHEVVVNPFSSR